MKYSTVLVQLLISLHLLVLSACVGTVQDTDVPLNSLSEESKDVIAFTGLDRGQAISDKKIELIFTPVASADPNLKYLLYINGSQSAIEISPDALDETVGGAKRYLLDNLNINTEYKFQLRLQNTLTNAQSTKEKVIVVKTFDNRTADFKGVTSVKKVIGLSATSIQVDWVPAKMDGVIITKEFDPLYYEVTVIGPGGAQNMNNKNYVGIDRREKRVPDPLFATISPINHSKHTSTIIDSLMPNTTYYVQVRAINKLYHLFSIDPSINVIPVNKEVNTKFLRIKTDPPTGNFEFNQDSLRLSNVFGLDAYTKVNAFWSPGEGTFTGYRLFYRKFSNPNASESTVIASDLLQTTTMDSISAGAATATDDAGRFINIPTDKTSWTIPNLQPYNWYQFRIVQCKNIVCPTAITDANAGIVSELRAIRVQASLAPFDGITKIENPKDASSQDEIKVFYDPPSLATGYADKLEVYCLDPDTIAGGPTTYQFHPTPLQPGIPIASSSISKCNGLSLVNEPSMSSKSLLIKGVKTIPSESAANATYCFAVFPAIRFQAEQIPAAGTYPKADWVVRCVTPEIKTPSIAQFGGLTNSCTPIQNTIRVTWTVPSGGIYSNYKLFYRPIYSTENFKFSDAIAGVAGYSSVSLASTDTSTTLLNLRPGTRYRLGILSEVTVGATKLYSEFNTSVKDCVTPMPLATFDEWTRVFAIGPKVDGRFPSEIIGSSRTIREPAKILEALNVDGVPYEVNLDSAGTIVPGSFVLAPGHYGSGITPTDYDDDFDGRHSKYRSVDVAASQNGIVSLGWKDVSLDFLGGEFTECQRHSGDVVVPSNPGCATLPATRKDRKYGYRVYRSDDNRLSWISVSGDPGATGLPLVYARDYKFRKRPNLSPTVDRMAFFTDYSVNSIYTDPKGKERGRILWYKIVPYFENKPLTIAGTGLVAPNIIKVVLPPPNMALLKREMANRNACLDIGRDGTIDKNSNGYYSCAFNGVGARPKGSPWMKGNTVVDLGGDLLIDRHELGCQYSRGDYISVPQDGASHFMRVGHNVAGGRTDLRHFKGFSTATDGSDKADKFIGCTIGTSTGATLDSSGVKTTSITPDYKKVIYGDCIGKGGGTTYPYPCASTMGQYPEPFRHPGAYDRGMEDCTIIDNDDPHNIFDRFNAEFRRNLMVQGEFGAVFYFRDESGVNLIKPLGPGNVPLVNNYQSASDGLSQCQINLAAVGSDGTLRARWFPVESLDKVKFGAGFQSLVNKSVGQVLNDANLYAAPEYLKPSAGLTTNNKFDLATKISRLATSNSSKLPPLTGVSQKIAQEFCSSYEVEIGVSTDGANFLPTTLPMPKRLLRKHEMIAGSRWPLAADNHASSYDYSLANILSLEGASAAGMCHHAGKKASTFALGRNASLSPMSATFDNSGTADTNGKTLTGSAATDTGGVNHSGKCISEFGIQDLVGNVAELTTERLFCDYTKDQLYFGQYDGGNPALQDGIGNVSLSIPIQDVRNPTIPFWSKTKIRYQNVDLLTFTDVGEGEGNPQQNANVTWADIDTTSGYCSVVDDVEGNSARSPAIKKRRYRDASDALISIFSNSGTVLNTNIVTRQNYVDQAGVDYLRNGDGYFLNFGFANIAPQFRDGNGLSIAADSFTMGNPNVALGPYFNPVVGFPMSCIGDACNESPDNQRVTTSYLNTKVTSPTPTIPDFPVGNSQIYNTGISDIVFKNNQAFYTMDLTFAQTNNGSLIIDEVIKYQNGTVTFRTIDIDSWWQESATHRGLQEFSGLNFVLARGTELTFSNGGSYLFNRSGRFTASTIDGSEEGTKSTSGIGFRCGVMINSD